MARQPQITPSKQVFKRLEEIRKEMGMYSVKFCKLIGISRSQWDCIRNPKPMGEHIYKRISENLGVSYEWLMEGTGEKYIGAPLHDAGYPLPVEELPDGQPVADDKSKPAERGQKHTPQIKSVKTLECYEFAKDGHIATIGFGKGGIFKYATVNGIQRSEWTFDDWMFLGEVAQEIKRLVQG